MSVRKQRRVAYLLGAGASHGSANAAGSSVNLLMRPGLILPLRDRINELWRTEFPDDPIMTTLANDLIDETTDIEQVITFLADSPSQKARDISRRLQTIFKSVLLESLRNVEEVEGRDYSFLYAALIDMHAVGELGETLSGVLTLNYDRFLEHAIEQKLRRGVDFGIGPFPAGEVVRVIKLHGSFYWQDAWPFLRDESGEAGHWIPPGVRKAKERWPFNALWGAGREVLDCDVLRVIGCNLSKNDWDLVSMLFSTQQTRRGGEPYEVEIIASPATAKRIQNDFAFLKAKSLLELEDVGPQIISESLGTHARRFGELTLKEQELAIANATSKATNALHYWLRQRAEVMHRELESISTPSGIFQHFLEEM